MSQIVASLRYWCRMKEQKAKVRLIHTQKRSPKVKLPCWNPKSFKEFLETQWPIHQVDCHLELLPQRKERTNLRHRVIQLHNTGLNKIITHIPVVLTRERFKSKAERAKNWAKKKSSMMSHKPEVSTSLEGVIMAASWITGNKEKGITQERL